MICINWKWIEIWAVEVYILNIENEFKPAGDLKQHKKIIDKNIFRFTLYQ